MSLLHTIPPSERLALIDADILSFKAAFIYDKDPKNVDLEELLLAMIQQWTNNIADQFIMCLTGSGNYRKTIQKTYKEHRKDKEPPTKLFAIREWFEDNFDTIVCRGFEADDYMAAYAQSHSHAVIVTTDKDLQQSPDSWLYNPDKFYFPVYITKEQAEYFLAYQLLVGDPADGYKGVKGIGPAKAAKHISGSDKLDVVKELYFVNDQDYEEAYWLCKILGKDDLCLDSLQVVNPELLAFVSQRQRITESEKQ